MITVHMMGNIGNQMFIYAMARSLQLRTGQKLTVDLGGLKRRYYTSNYKLDCFDISQDINYDLNQLGFIRRSYYKISTFIYRIQHYYYRRKNGYTSPPEWLFRWWLKRGCYYNTGHSFFDSSSPLKKDINVYGYFQSEKYFKDYKDVIKREFQVKAPVSDKDKTLISQMQSCNSVAVSIRANKAPENPKFNDNIILGFFDKDYYFRGMEEITKRVDNPVFYIFADDLSIVKTEYDFPYPVIYVTPDDSATGIRLMTKCKHFVIANSTFSWWGVYLAENEDKIVVMPDRWDRSGPSREDIYFGNPIRLSVNYLTE